jgi:hypothetical protein
VGTDSESGKGIWVQPAAECDLPAVTALRHRFYVECPQGPWQDQSWQTRENDILDVIRCGGALIAQSGNDPYRLHACLAGGE